MSEVKVKGFYFAPTGKTYKTKSGFLTAQRVWVEKNRAQLLAKVLGYLQGAPRPYLSPRPAMEKGGRRLGRLLNQSSVFLDDRYFNSLLDDLYQKVFKMVGQNQEAATKAREEREARQKEQRERRERWEAQQEDRRVKQEVARRRRIQAAKQAFKG